jgi:hypothetical protein
VDTNLSGITPANKAEALYLLQRAWGPRKAELCKYWLLEASRAHERVHLEQFKKVVPREFRSAVEFLKGLRLPSDYCRLSEAEVEKSLGGMQSKARWQFRAVSEYIAYIFSAGSTGTFIAFQEPAFNAGYRKALALMKRIKNEIH